MVDAVNDSEPARDTWRRAASSTDVPVRFVLLTPPGPDVHRRRLQSRSRALEHVPEPTWQQVLERSRAYEPWPDEPLVVDGALELDNVVEQVVRETAAGDGERSRPGRNMGRLPHAPGGRLLSVEA